MGSNTSAVEDLPQGRLNLIAPDSSYRHSLFTHQADFDILHPAYVKETPDAVIKIRR